MRGAWLSAGRGRPGPPARSGPRGPCRTACGSSPACRTACARPLRRAARAAASVPPPARWPHRPENGMFESCGGFLQRRCARQIDHRDWAVQAHGSGDPFVQRAHELFAGVDAVDMWGFGATEEADAENAVFTGQEHAVLRGQAVGHLRRHADAQVNHGVLRQVAGHLLGPLSTVEAFHAASSCRSRLTNRLGVMITSGANAPSATICSTSTMVVAAPMHMMGPKLRCAYRYTRLPVVSAWLARTNAKSAASGSSST